MKKVQFSLFALSVMTGGVLTTFAAPKPPTIGSTYVLDAVFTNNPPLIADVTALPQSTGKTNLLNAGGFGVIATDGGGKISGVQDITSDLGGGTNGSFVASISGSISTVGGAKATNGAAKLTMTIKGTGYADGGGFQIPATMNLTFKGLTGIVPITQGISNAMPGWNFRLNPDGTTNLVQRYDPWMDITGNLESWTTYAGTVHTYKSDTLYTTNEIAGGPTNLIVTNFVQQSVANIDLRGNEYGTNSGGLFLIDSPIVKFGTPILTDLNDGFFGTNAHGVFQFTNAIYGSNVSVGRWVIATQDGIETVGTTNNTVYTSNAMILSTNFLLSVFDTDQTGLPNNGNALPPHSTVINIRTNSGGSNAQGLQTNVNYSSREYIVLTPIATNTIYTTNMFYEPVDYSLVDNENTNTTQNPGLTVEFHNRVWSDVYTNNTLNQYITRQDYRLAVALQSSVDTTLGNGTNIIVYTNTFVTYSSSVTNLTYTTNTYPTFGPNPIQFVEYAPGDIFVNYSLYTNMVDYSSSVTYSNFAVITNAVTIYGANIADLPTALLAFNSVNNNTNSYQHSGSMYDRDFNLPSFMGNYLWANQEDDFFSKGVVVGILTNFQTPFFTNFIVAVRTPTNSYAYISGVLNGSVNAGKLKETFKNSAALFEENHDVYTPITPSAPGEQSYFITHFEKNLNVLTKSNLTARVVQLGTKFSTASPENAMVWGSDDAYIGSGTDTPTKGTYKATLKGVARSAGSSLTLNGATDTIITSYTPVTNAPAVSTSFTNLAAPDSSFVLTVTSTSSGILTTNFSHGVTNVTPAGVSFLIFNYGDVSVTNFVYQTNTVPNGIRSVVMNGKIMGQTLVKNGVIGTNYNAQFVVGPVVGAAGSASFTTNFFGWSTNAGVHGPTPPFPPFP